MQTDKALAMLGLMARAGQLAVGESQALQSVRAGKSAGVLLDAGASDNTRKRFLDACHFRELFYQELEPGRLAQAIGKPGRKVVSLGTGSLAEQVKTLLSPD